MELYKRIRNTLGKMVKEQARSFILSWEIIEDVENEQKFKTEKKKGRPKNSTQKSTNSLNQISIEYIT